MDGAKFCTSAIASVKMYICGEYKQDFPSTVSTMLPWIRMAAYVSLQGPKTTLPCQGNLLASAFAIGAFTSDLNL